MFLLILALQHAGAQRLTGGRAVGRRFAPPSGQSGASRRFRMAILVLKNLILIGLQNHRKTKPQTAHFQHFWLHHVGEYFVACYPIRVATLIDFGPFFIRVTALIDVDTLFGLGSLP